MNADLVLRNRSTAGCGVRTKTNPIGHDKNPQGRRTRPPPLTDLAARPGAAFNSEAFNRDLRFWRAGLPAPELRRSSVSGSGSDVPFPAPRSPADRSPWGVRARDP